MHFNLQEGREVDPQSRGSRLISVAARNLGSDLPQSRATSPALVPVPERGTKANPFPSIPPHMIATVRNCQGLSTAELADRLNVAPAEIDAIRGLGHYSGGDLLKPSNGSTWLRAEQAAERF
jgi:hypothetical protein